MFDDCSYSGSQLSQNINNTCKDNVRYELCIPYITNEALKYIKSRIKDIAIIGVDGHSYRHTATATTTTTTATTIRTNRRI